MYEIFIVLVATSTEGKTGNLTFLPCNPDDPYVGILCAVYCELKGFTYGYCLHDVEVGYACHCF